MYVISNPDELENFFILTRHEAKYPMNIDVSNPKRMKTLKQLKYIFGGIIKALNAYFKELQGKEYEPDILKSWLYFKVGVNEIINLPDGNTAFERITLSKMDIDQATEFINKVLLFIDNETTCILPPVLRYTWLLHVKDNELQELMNYKYPDKSPEYLSYIRSLSCIHCGVYGTEPHHIKQSGHSGTATKSGDWFTIPLCRICHDKAHTQGQDTILKGLMLYGYHIAIFCKLAYKRWLFKKG